MVLVYNGFGVLKNQEGKTITLLGKFTYFELDMCNAKQR